LGRLEVRWEKVACWSTKLVTKAAISLKRVKIEEVTMGGLQGVTNALSTPYDLLFP